MNIPIEPRPQYSLYITHPTQKKSGTFEVITSAMDLFIPKIILRVRQFPIWLTPQLCHSRKCLCILQHKFNKNPSPNNINSCVMPSNLSMLPTLLLRPCMNRELCHQQGSHFIKEFTKTHVLPPQLHADSTSADTDTDKAELFNQYFYSVFTRSDFPVPDPIAMDLHVPDNPLESIFFSI